VTPETLEQKLRAAGYEAPSLPHLCRSCDVVLLPEQPCGARCQECLEQVDALERPAPTVLQKEIVVLTILVGCIGSMLVWIGIATLAKMWWFR